MLVLDQEPKSTPKTMPQKVTSQKKLDAGDNEDDPIDMIKD